MLCFLASSFPSTVVPKNLSLVPIQGPRRSLGFSGFGQQSSGQRFCSSVARRPHLRAVCEAVKQQAGFFDRVHEKEQLAKRLLGLPSSVTCVLGPKNVGKSALLANCVESGEGTKVCLVDCRPSASYYPDGFAAALLQAIPPDFADTFLSFLKETFQTIGVEGTGPLGKLKGTAKLGAALSNALEKKPSAGALGLVIDAYKRFLSRTPKDQRPVIIIDEANILFKWLGTFENELDSLITFFLWITKQKRLAHVVLATSDYSFLLWLQKRVKSNDVKAFVIGEMAPTDARSLFEKELGKKVDDEGWKKISEVCGGNPGMLVACAGDGVVAEAEPGAEVSWDAVLESTWVGTRTVVENGLEPDSGSGYTARQYAAVVLRLLEAPSGAVLVSEMKKILGGSTAGAQVLEALVKKDLVSYRPYSPWATDIPIKVFGPRRTPVVTAPTSVHLYCMRMMEPEFRLAAEKEQPVPLEPVGQPASSLPAVQAVEADIRKVESKIEEVEAQIGKADAQVEECVQEQNEVKKGRGEGWQLELQELRQREVQLRENLKQLRRKEEQLRKEKEQLREQLLLLLKGVVE